MLVGHYQAAYGWKTGLCLSMTLNTDMNGRKVYIYVPSWIKTIAFAHTLCCS
jgi:hypothetical protein